MTKQNLQLAALAAAVLAGGFLIGAGAHRELIGLAVDGFNAFLVWWAA
jgi:hypothetical protein